MPAVLGVAHSPPAIDVPAGACDTHVHIFGPYDRYPLVEDRVYMPSLASVGDLVGLQRGRKKVAVADLLRFPWIFATESVMGRTFLDAMFAKQGSRTPRASVDSTSVHAALRIMSDARRSDCAVRAGLPSLR